MDEALSLQEILKIVKKRLFLIISFVVITVAVTTLLLFYLISPIYSAQTQILVNQNNVNQEVYGWTELETALQLIDTYNVIIKSPAILNKVIEELNLTVTSESLSNQISVSNENNSKVVNIIVEDEDFRQAVAVANKVAEVFKEEVPTLMNVDNINILSSAAIDDNPISVKPNKILFIGIAGLTGLLVSIGLAILLEILDSTIKSEKDIEEILDLPVIGSVSLMKGYKNHQSSRM